MSNPRPHNLKTEQLDMDSFFDFSQGTSPATATSSKMDATPKTASQDWNNFDQEEQRQRFNGPSHDYNLHKQQVGLPMGSMHNMPMQYDGFNSGFGDMGFDGGMSGFNSGIDLDADMNMDFNNPQSGMPAMFFPPPTGNNSQADNFVDPNSIGGDEPTSNVGRLWPGMHSQQAHQAAMAKAAQVQQAQQRQMKIQAYQAQHRQSVDGMPRSQPLQQGHANGKRPSHVTEPHVEESISRLLSQMRQNNHAQPEDEGSPSNMLPHIARLKKDEDEMDEDERLLASEDGKKLSSKERRQLRNKVSARAFRSRRKEYIGQLEGEVALKTQESTTLRQENSALMQENERYRGLIETLLRHPAFTPFINDLSNDPSMLASLQQPSQPQPQSQSVTPQPTSQQQSQPSQPQPQPDTKPDFMNFDASQLQVPSQQKPQPQQQSERVSLAMIPENDFSKLNLNGFQGMNFNNYQRVNAFAVTSLPMGPDPVDLLTLSSAHLPASCSSSSTSDSASLDVLLAKLDGAARNMEGREAAI